MALAVAVRNVSQQSVSQLAMPRFHALGAKMLRRLRCAIGPFIEIYFFNLYNCIFESIAVTSLSSPEPFCWQGIFITITF